MALVELSDLDTRHFGVRAARVANVTADTLPRILDRCHEERIQFLIARCDASDVAAAQAMCAQRFGLMDTLVYWDRPLTIPLAESRTTVVVRPVRRDEIASVCEIAEQAFTGYVGHYHADPRLDRARCVGVYVSWAERSCLSREVADDVLVGEIDGRIVGFITVRGGETGTAMVGGVRPDARGLGVYRTLLESSVRWCTAAGSQRMEISTQVTNNATQKVWGRLGFQPHHAEYTFHKWFDDASSLPAKEDRR